MNRVIRIFVAIWAAVALAGCTASLYTSSLGYSDDMYTIPDYQKFIDTQAKRRAELEAAKQKSAESSLEKYKAMAEAQGIKYNEVESFDNLDLGRVATTYESAYAHRLKGQSSISYKMPSSYYDLRYSSDFQFLSAYDPMVYNVVVMGSEVWVEPKYISSMFGTWGAPSYSTSLYWGPAYSSLYGYWGYDPYYWGYYYPYNYSWWGYPYNPYYGWYDPWFYPPMWYPGHYPGYHPKPPHNPGGGAQSSYYPNYHPRPSKGSGSNYRGLQGSPRPSTGTVGRPGTTSGSRFDFSPRPGESNNRTGSINRPSSGRGQNNSSYRPNNDYNRPTNSNQNRNSGYNNSNSSNYRQSSGSMGGGYTQGSGGGSSRGGGGNYRGR